MAKAVERLTDMLGFLTTLRGLKSDADSIDTQKRLLNACLVDVRQSPGFSASDGKKMLEEVRSATIPDWMRDEILQCVQDMVVSGVGGEKERKGRVPMQRNLHLYNYFTQDEWDSLGNSCNTLDTKLQVVSKRCGLIGLTAPAETTYVLAVSIIIMACHKGQPEDLVIDAQKTFGMLKDLKVVLKNVCKRTTHSGLQVYPESPRDLSEELLKAAYQTAKPAKCLLDILEWLSY